MCDNETSQIDWKTIIIIIRKNKRRSEITDLKGKEKQYNRIKQEERRANLRSGRIHQLKAIKFIY